MNPKSIVLRIGGITFSVSIHGPSAAVDFGENYRAFISDGPADVSVSARYDGLPEVSLREDDLVFDSGGLWTLYRSGEKHVVVLRSTRFGCEPYRIAVLEPDLHRADVYTRPDVGDEAGGGRLPHPLEYPLSELLMICLLARGRGLMVHSCGIDDRGAGYLFAGNSGDGKTTISRLWTSKATVLNDDRIVLRLHEGRAWMYGTPWHGDSSGVSPQGVEVSRIFLLRHASANRAKLLSGATAVSMLLSRSFLPFWSTQGMRFSLEICMQLAACAPCHELGFVPDDSAVDFVRSIS